MRIRDLIPWSRRKHEVSVRRDGLDPVHALQSDINRAFEDFWRGFGPPHPGALSTEFPNPSLPPIDLHETDRQVEVLVELPGMEEKDIDVSVAEGTLMIRGEHKSERESKDKGYIRRERSFGAIERMVPLPDGLDLDATKATFKNGVLSVMIPKTAEARDAVKRISVRHG
jgi:HSP20 family protein